MRSDLIRRSHDAEGSPVSILALRDWLEWRRVARSACVRFPAPPTVAKALANLTLRSMDAASSALSR